MKNLLFYLFFFSTAILFAQEVDRNRYNLEGRKDGLWVEVSNEDSTFVTKLNYVNGVKNGVYQTYRDNNLIGDGFMKGGELHGEFITYDENGTKTSILKWDMGSLVDQKLLNPNAKET